MSTLLKGAKHNGYQHIMRRPRWEMGARLKIVSSSEMCRNGTHQHQGRVERVFSRPRERGCASVMRSLMGFAPHSPRQNRGYGWRRASGRPETVGRPDRLLRYSDGARLGLVDDPIS